MSAFPISLLIIAAAVVHACTPGRPAVSLPESAPDAVDGLLLTDVMVVIRGQDTARASILFERDRGFRIREIGPTISTPATDMLDGSGLYLHSANTFDQGADLDVGTAPMLVLRHGISAGSPAFGLLMADEENGLRRIAPEENHPPGDVPAAVGCYAVERGDWDDPVAGRSLAVAPVPEDIRLHWQYAWHLGRERVLVATRADGAVPGAQTNYFGWRQGAGDTIRVWFGTGFVGATFTVVPRGDTLTGEVLRRGDTMPGPRARAAVVMRRIACGTAAAARPVEQDRLWVAVIREDGVAVPVATYTQGAWSTPWPEVADRVPAAPAPPEVPGRWYIHVDGAAASAVRFDELVVADAYCVRTWAYTTDWADRVLARPGYVVPVAGMLLSEPIALLPADSVPGIEQLRERLGLVSNDRRGEGTLTVTVLGYFRLDDRVVGVFVRRGYEGEEYVIVETGAGGDVVARRHGGGC
jgi:hypothetical protein